MKNSPMSTQGRPYKSFEQVIIVRGISWLAPHLIASIETIGGTWFGRSTWGRNDCLNKIGHPR
jgi:hypothetical protein